MAVCKILKEWLLFRSGYLLWETLPISITPVYLAYKWLWYVIMIDGPWPTFAGTVQSKRVICEEEKAIACVCCGVDLCLQIYKRIHSLVTSTIISGQYQNIGHADTGGYLIFQFLTTTDNFNSWLKVRDVLSFICFKVIFTTLFLDTLCYLPFNV